MIIAAVVMMMGLIIFAAQIITISMGVPLPGPDLIVADPVGDLALKLTAVAVALPVVYGAAAFQRRPPGTLSSVAGRLRWPWLLTCVLLALAAALIGQATTIALSAVTGNSSAEFTWAGWEVFLPAMAVLLLVPLQAAAEEYIFRGWLLQAFGTFSFFRSPWPGILLSAAGFTALHAYTDWGILDVFAFGVLMGWLTVRTGGLEAAIALHVVNNVLGLGISAASGSLEDVLRQGSVPWESLIGTATQLLFFTLVVLILARWRGVQTTTEDRSASLSPSSSAQIS